MDTNFTVMQAEGFLAGQIVKNGQFGRIGAWSQNLVILRTAVHMHHASAAIQHHGTSHGNHEPLVGSALSLVQSSAAVKPPSAGASPFQPSCPSWLLICTFTFSFVATAAGEASDDEGSKSRSMELMT